MAKRALIELSPDSRQIRQAPGRPPGRGGSTNGNGQPPFIPTDAQRARIMTLVAAGFTNESIAVVMAIPSETLERHFDFELKQGKVVVDAKVLGGIVERAIEGDKTMAIWYSKTRGGWSERGGQAGDPAAAAALFSIQIGANLGGDHAPEISITALPRAHENESEEEP